MPTTFEAQVLALPAGARPRMFERPQIVLAIIALGLIITAGTFGLFEPTETRYAEIAREMRADGDFMIPRLNGIAHLHKPPFVYWCTAAGMALFGENSLGVRLPVAAASVCTLLFVWVALRRRFGSLVRPTPLALWMFASMALPFVFGRSLASDPFLSASVAAYWAFAPSPLAIAVLGVGFLIKGPVVFVPTVLVVLVAAAWGRARAPLRLLGPGWSWILCAAIGLPWYVVAVSRMPGLASYLLTNQLWQRYATHVHHRTGPAWYFVAVLLVGALPWTPALIAGLVRAWRSREREDARLLLAWVFAPLLFFSCSGSKLPSYLLPTFPAVACLATLGLERAGRAVHRTLAITLAVLALATLGLGVAPIAQFIPGAGGVAPLPWLTMGAFILWAAAATLMLQARTQWAAALTLAGWVTLVLAFAPVEGPFGSPRPLARVLIQQRATGEPVIEYRHFNAGLPFYLRERVLLLDVGRELFFTPLDSQSEVVIGADAIVPLVTQHGRAWLLAPGHSGEELANSLGLDYRRIAGWRQESLGELELSAKARAH